MTSSTAHTHCVRAFYEQTITRHAETAPGATAPAYDDLDSFQRRTWTLAFAATTELAVRVTEALASVGVEP